MKKFLFLLPVPLPRAALDNFAAQLTIKRADIEIDFAGPRDGASLMDSAYESTLADALVLDAGLQAERDGYSALCSFSMSDSGVAALRSRLMIPVVGAGQAALFQAAQLGKRFSVITMWAPWAHHAEDNVAKYGMKEKLASVRHINTRPDTHELLAGKEDVVFAKLEAEALLAIEQDGAEVIVLGSTTMYQSHAYLAAHLPCPVVNPGWAAYKACEALVDMGLAQSKLSYPPPEKPNDALFAGIAPKYS
jgi:allantoin racemase